MRRLKLTLEYDGTDFFGWQVQARTGERTVQGVVQEAWAKLPGTHTSLKAAGRTDAGVHALAMVAHLDTDTPVEEADLTRALNAHLPPDVRVLNVVGVAPTFDAQYDCRYRRYLYRLRFTQKNAAGAALDRHRVLHLYQTLGIPAMQRAAHDFQGTRDFSALATQETRSRERTVYLCRLDHDSTGDGRDLTLHVAADGFLRGMVRAVVGTLLEVGTGRLDPDEVLAVLASKDRARAGKNVPPHGLYFVEAGYKAWGLEDSSKV